MLCWAREESKSPTTKWRTPATKTEYNRSRPIWNINGQNAGLYLTGGSEGFDPPQELAAPQKVLQSLFGGRL